MSSLMIDLREVRKQIDLYRHQHNGNFPGQTTFADEMTKKTDADGTVNASGKFGPYMLRIPTNPFTVGGTGVDVTNTAAAANKAWFYEATTGEFKANDGGTTNTVAHGSL
jgi:hypothetical protein